MKEITLKVYSIDELHGKAKQRALDKAREMFTVSSEEIKEYLSECLLSYGIKDLEVRFSLGYCQGDGVSFVGSIDLEQLPKESVEQKEIHAQLDGESATASVAICGHYTNYNSMYVIVEEHKNFEKLEDLVLNWLQDISKDLTSDGYGYIESMGSDDVMIDTCDANDILFMEDGRIAP